MYIVVSTNVHSPVNGDNCSSRFQFKISTGIDAAGNAFAVVEKIGLSARLSAPLLTEEGKRVYMQLFDAAGKMMIIRPGVHYQLSAHWEFN